MTAAPRVAPQPPPKWAKVIDQTRCIGCHACSTACKSENEVPLSVNRTYVKYVDLGTFPNTRRAFQVTRCNQCDDPPCVHACPTAAMYRREDGIVDFDKSRCIGCKACIAACPYDAIFINPDDHSAEKCNFCAHRLDVGLEPACVVVCPTQAILVGDLNDPTTAVSNIVGRDAVSVRQPEKETQPKLFYKGAHEATLDPLAAQRPTGGLFMWSEQLSGSQHVVAGHPIQGTTSSAAALLSYDVPHSVPWDWRVSLYTWTKGIAAGAYLVPLLLFATGRIPANDMLWQWAGPLVAAIFLAITGLLLVWDLEHPARFFYIFTKAQYGSWLVRGAYVIGGYTVILIGHVVGSVLRIPQLQTVLAFLGLPLAVLAAVYTAYLFAQARARDLWQSPLLAPHLAVQALLAGSGVLALVTTVTPSNLGPTLLWIVAGTSLVHVVLVTIEITVAHATAHAQLATAEMTRGRYRRFFWTGLLLASVGFAAPWLGTPGAVLALVGLLAYEHAYVQAGQAVPLA